MTVGVHRSKSILCSGISRMTGGMGVSLAFVDSPPFSHKINGEMSLSYGITLCSLAVAVVALAASLASNILGPIHV